jgi:magnesium chelatase family protein
MLAAVRSATLLGVEGRPVTVEVHVSTGLPGFQIVGLPDEACRESRDRVRAAVMSSGLPWPSCRITVNLAPPKVRQARIAAVLAGLSASWANVRKVLNELQAIVSE